jgi:DNA modification methylase
MQNIVNPEIPLEEYANYMPDDLQEYKKELGMTEKDTEPQIDKAQELLAKWQVKPGQVWQLGKHKIICGDCTDLATVEKLMAGEKANLLFTSPPYWIGKNYETQNSEKEIDYFIEKCIKTWTDFITVDYGRICINTGSAAIHRIEKNRKVEVLPLIDKWQFQLKQRGWLARHWRIWAKSGDFPATISAKADVVDQHWEHIVTFDNEFSFLGTWWAPSGFQRGQEKIGTKWAQQGVWTDIHGQKSGEGSHIAAFPLELPLRNIMLYSQDGEITIDPFIGSGTTLIACENLNRQCRGIEIAPEYIAVTLQRWQDHTGKTPQLLQE